MIRRFTVLAVGALAFVPVLLAQGRLTPPGVQPFISFSDAVFTLAHVRVIDGSGSPARADQTILLDHGSISAAGSAASVQAPSGARTPGRPPFEQRTVDAMSPEAATSYLTAKEHAAGNPNARNFSWLKKEMDFEREFVAAGGLLIADFKGSVAFDPAKLIDSIKGAVGIHRLMFEWNRG